MRLGLICKNILIVSSLLGLTLWFYMQTKSTGSEQQKSHPQEYMVEFQATNFDLNGQPKETLSAAYWEYKPQLKHSDLIKPKVTIFKENGEIWYLNSNKALAWHETLHDKISKINMQDGVIIERPSLPTHDPIKLETTSLEYALDQEIVSTSEFVTMTQPGLMISGYGLIGYLDRNWIELHDKITTIYTAN